MTSRRIQRAKISGMRRPTAGKGVEQQPLDVENGTIPNRTPHFESGKGDSIGAGRRVSARGMIQGGGDKSTAAEVINKGRSAAAKDAAVAENDAERAKTTFTARQNRQREADFQDLPAGRAAEFAAQVGEMTPSNTSGLPRKTGLAAQPADKAAGPAMGVPAAMPKDSTKGALNAEKAAADAAAGERTGNSGAGTRAGLFDPNRTAGANTQASQQMRSFNKNKRRRARQQEKRRVLSEAIAAEQDPQKKAELQAQHDSVKGYETFSKTEKTVARALDRDRAAKAAKESTKISKQAEKAGITPEELKARQAPSPARQSLYDRASSLLEQQDDSSSKSITAADVVPGAAKELEVVHRHLGIPKPHVKTLITKKYPELSVREGLSAMFNLRTNGAKDAKTGKTAWEMLRDEAIEHSASETARQSEQAKKNAKTSRRNKRANNALMDYEKAKGVAQMAGEQFDQPRPVHPDYEAHLDRVADAAVNPPTETVVGEKNSMTQPSPAQISAMAFDKGPKPAAARNRANRKSKFVEVSGPRPTVSLPNRPRTKKAAPKKKAE